jgi:hypothetical protein
MKPRTRSDLIKMIMECQVPWKEEHHCRSVLYCGSAVLLDERVMDSGEMDAEAAEVGEGPDSELATGKAAGASAGFSVAMAVAGSSEVVANWWFSTLTGGDPMIGVASGTLSSDGSSTGCMRL